MNDNNKDSAHDITELKQTHIDKDGKRWTVVKFNLDNDWGSVDMNYFAYDSSGWQYSYNVKSKYHDWTRFDAEHLKQHFTPLPGGRVKCESVIHGVNYGNGV